jgi:hypothetical protein
MSEAHCNNLAQRKALGLVTHDNTGGPFVVECQGCGEVYPSFHCLGGGQIADTGDYDDAVCPHCDQVDPEECDNAALAWNTQQLKINALQQRLNAADQRIDGLTAQQAESRMITLSGCEFSEHELLRTAVRMVTGTSRRGTLRWVAMKDAFCCGSGVAHALCRRFGFDPDETVKP